MPISFSFVSYEKNVVPIQNRKNHFFHSILRLNHLITMSYVKGQNFSQIEPEKFQD